MSWSHYLFIYLLNCLLHHFVYEWQKKTDFFIFRFVRDFWAGVWTTSSLPIIQTHSVLNQHIYIWPIIIIILINCRRLTTVVLSFQELSIILIFIREWHNLQFNVDSERQIFEKHFHDKFIYSQSFWGRGNRRRKFLFCFDVWPGIRTLALRLMSQHTTY